jgi:integrase
VRIVVPKNLRATLGKANLTRRLGRLTKTEANRLSARVIDEFFALIDAARSGDSLAGISPRPTAEPIMITPPALVADLFDGYLRERSPSAATVKRWRPVFESLVRHVGHADVGRIGVQHIIRWKEALLGEGVSARTIRDVYLAAAKVVFAWGLENRRLAFNPAQDVRVRVPRGQRLRGPSFTKEEAERILGASLAQQPARLSAEHARARRWIPWMCAYSGARVGEISQLRACDFVQIDGIWAMNITPEAGTTKSGCARMVPIHPHLLEQGLIEMVRKVGDMPLFYDPRRAREGRAGNPHHKKVGERLAKWVRELGVDDPHVQPNHGWRHLFKTSARRAGIEPELRDAIQGHAPRSVGEAYGDWPLDVLAQAISLLPRFNVAHAHRASASTTL